MPQRFYAPDLAPDRTEVALSRDEADHATRVLRLGAGETVSVFDGRGNEFLARISSVGPGGVTVTLIRRVTPAPEPSIPVTLAQAVLKAEKMDEVVRDVAMLGVAAVQALVSSRSELSMAALERGHRVERWRRVAIASVKQCGRAVVPRVHEAARFDDFLETDRSALRLILVEPRARQGSEGGLEALSKRAKPSTVSLIVGPEGGWTPEEIDRARVAGCAFATLGERTLRADVTPVIALAVLQYLWGDL